MRVLLLTSFLDKFVAYAINSILFQRDVFRPDQFEMVKKYDLPLMILKDVNILKKILNDAQRATSDNGLKRVILALFEENTDKVIEKWEFKISSDSSEDKIGEVGFKSSDVIQAEIRAVLKQVLG